MYYENFMIGFHFFCSERSQQTFVGLQDMSWRRFQHVFSITVFCLPRRHLARCLEDLQDIFKRSWKIKNFMLKTSWGYNLKTSSRDVLKTSWIHVLKTPPRHLGDTLETNKMFRGYVRCYISNPYLTNLYLTNLREIQNALIRNFEIQATVLF